jgi:hypothetical protein
MRRCIFFTFVLLNSCVVRHAGMFLVLPGDPNYLLRSPDGREDSFPETLRRYNGFLRGGSGMELLPKMGLRIENAYYQEGKPKRGLDGYLGTEIAHYRVMTEGGLKLLCVKSMSGRPADQLPVEQLIPDTQQRYHYYRFYFEILFKNGSTPRGSVLLGANSQVELNDLAELLHSQPDTVCESKSAHCIVFPEACSVSVEMAVAVNGASLTVVWGSTLESVMSRQPRQISLHRLNAGQVTVVQLDAQDKNALKLPLVPGDRIEWK